MKTGVAIILCKPSNQYTQSDAATEDTGLATMGVKNYTLCGMGEYRLHTNRIGMNTMSGVTDTQREQSFTNVIFLFPQGYILIFFI